MEWEFSIADALAIAWFLTYIQIGRGSAPRLLGNDLLWGMPRWRSASNIPTQVMLFTGLCAGSWTCGEGLLSNSYASGTTVGWQWCFDRLLIVMFAEYMVLDFALAFAGIIPPFDRLIALHHIVCLVGHGIATTTHPRGFAVYFAGVAVLEFGSAFCNLWSLYPRRRAAQHAYLVMMSVTNMLALLCTLCWLDQNSKEASVQLRILISLLMFGLTFMRQKEAISQLNQVGYLRSLSSRWKAAV